MSLKRSGIAMLTFVSLAFAVAAQAIDIETVPVGNINNAPDPATNLGAVDHAYNIGKFEVTAGEYTVFLNAVAKTDPNGLYNSGMSDIPYGCRITRTGDSGSYQYDVSAEFADRPVNGVNFWATLRFANWLNNGQPGLVAPVAQDRYSTEDGAYTLNGYNGSDGRWINRNAGAQWWIPSDDEWYKAAYHDKNSGLAAAYFNYPTASNSTPGHDLNDVSGNNANCHIAPFPLDGIHYLTVKGQFARSDSPYGTFDQGGNVNEWTDSLFGSASRGYYGGSFMGSSVDDMLSTNPYTHTGPTNVNVDLGFRVACVPEPGSIMMIAIFASVGLMYAWRKLFAPFRFAP